MSWMYLHMDHFVVKKVSACVEFPRILDNCCVPPYPSPPALFLTFILSCSPDNLKCFDLHLPPFDLCPAWHGQRAPGRRHSCPAWSCGGNRWSFFSEFKIAVVWRNGVVISEFKDAPPDVVPLATITPNLSQCFHHNIAAIQSPQWLFILSPCCHLNWTPKLPVQCAIDKVGTCDRQELHVQEPKCVSVNVSFYCIG